ncbi:cupin domain-containing protein [Tahibacter caeni]|uniref:cupin domain-containing protein n=1 Tax=Tahibacter caeni TaxID=1453545 RepID=UPI002147B956|nr:cupin domain-containing protein [Tahibacter caeni]
MPDESPAPVIPVAAGTVPWETAFEGTRFGVRYRHLSAALLGEGYRVGVAFEELEPGRQSAPAHYHVFEEEHLYLLDGRLTVRIGAERYAMEPGGYVCFPAGRAAGHCLINEGDATCRYLIIGENDPDEVAVYTDSNKVLVRSLGRRALLDLSARRDYWHGENTGAAIPPDPQEPLLPVPAPSFPPIASDTVEVEDTDEGPSFGGQARHLTYAAVGADYRVGVLIESPAPGKRLAPRHYHLFEEEHAYVLEGELTLLLGDARHPMKAGDYVAFPAGRPVAHSFLNSGNGPCRYLIIGERKPHDVCVYPDSGKVAVKALGRGRDVLDLSATRGYWDGETAS